MIWQIWSFAMGLPLGLLGMLAMLAVGVETPAGLSFAAAIVGAALAGALVTALVHLRGGGRARRIRVAAAASASLLALPACAAVILGLASSALCLLGLSVSVWAAALCWGAWGKAHDSPPLRQILQAALLFGLGGSVVSVLLFALVAASGARQPAPDQRRSAQIFAQDAQVETRSLPFCAQAVASVRPLFDRGAHPRMDLDGGKLWFDAEVDDGSRQVHRLDRSNDQVLCWTCGQAGNNRRPAPNRSGARIVFDSDRHVDLIHSTNTEIYQMRARGEHPPPNARRLTFSPGADERVSFGPGSGLLVWSRQESGRYFVASASIVSAHGGALLGDPAVLFAGGSAWVAPLAWSPNARSLLVVRGNPFRPLPALSLDLATGSERQLLEAVSGQGGAGFSADGDWLALVSTSRGRLAGLLPDRLGFLLAPLQAFVDPDAPRFRGTAVATGALGSGLAEIDLGKHAGWGEPTGVALSPDGRTLVLGQRRGRSAGNPERLIEVRLRCAEPRGGPAF